MAPSQRDPNKRAFSVSFEKKLIERIDTACQEEGTNRTAFLKSAATEKLDQLAKAERKQSKGK